MTEKEDIAIDDGYLDAELKSLLDGTQEGKKLFYKFIKKWQSFLDPLDNKEDRLILLKMIVEVCNHNEGVSNMINLENSESYADLEFFFLVMIQQQKRIDSLNSSDKKKKDVTLLDFIPK